MSLYTQKIPVVPQVPLILNNDMHPEWKLYHMQLNDYLHRNVGAEGYVAPSQSTSNIALLTTANNGTMVYDSNAHKLKVNENGTFKTVTTT